MGIVTQADVQLLSKGTTPLLSSYDGTALDIQYRDTGPKDSPVLVFLHGLGSHSAAWRAVVAGLPTMRCISWDAPGFGGSARVVSDSPTADDYVARLHKFIVALDLASVHVVGSSWGAVIAARFAALHPDRVDTLTLLAPNVCLGGLPEQVRAQVLDDLLSPAIVLEASPEAFVAMLAAPDVPDKVRAIAGLIKDQTTPEGYRQAVRMMGATNTLDWVSKITAPTLVLGGSSDTLAPVSDHAAPIVAAIPGARLEVIEGYGHLLKLECPDRVAASIRAHVSGSKASQ